MRTILRYLLLCLLLTCFGVGKGQLWEPLGIQLDHQPLVLYADSTSNLLYLGGYFQQVNGISVNGLISYNGTSWDTVGTNFQGYETKSFTRYQGKLWVGGALYLGVLDGQQWSNVTVNGVVNALLNYEGKLIAAGGFDTIAGIPINNLAAFDGQTWSPFHGSDTAIYSPLCIIHTLQEYRGALIVGGNIGQLGAMKEVLQWDGIQWRDLGGGIEGTGFVQVLDLEVFNGELYVAGQFAASANGQGNNIARWNGIEWDPVGGGVGPAQVFQLFSDSAKLYVAGAFTNAGGLPARYIATWDGSNWCAFAGVLDAPPKPMARYQNQFYLGGAFATIGSDSLLYLAKWVGGNHVDSCISQPVRIHDPALTQNPTISLYPNPTNSSFTLTLPPNTSTCTLKIHDITGREVAASRTYRAGEPPVDVTHLSAGLYFVEVRRKDRVEVVKLVKQ